MFDARITPEWPQAVLDALADLRQGDVIPWPAETAYVTTDRDVLYGAEPSGDEPPTGELFAAALEPAPSLAIITTQTCDIDEQGVPRRKPWVLYAPVVDGSATPGRGLTAWKLDGPGLPGGQWYADLRLEGCIEKNALVGMPVTRGFATEAGAAAFAQHLGRLRARPALANHLVETVTEHLRQYRKHATKGTRNRLKRELLEVRLDIRDGTPLDPRAVRIVVLHHGDPSAEARDWFGEWWDLARVAAKESGIELHAVLHLDAHNLDYRLIKDLIPVDISG